LVWLDNDLATPNGQTELWDRHSVKTRPSSDVEGDQLPSYTLIFFAVTVVAGPKSVPDSCQAGIDFLYGRVLLWVLRDPINDVLDRDV
jgi:hypothetical protein